VNFDSFLTYLSSEKRSSPHTVEAYRSDLAQFSSYCQTAYDLQAAEEVTSSVVRSWMAHLLENGYENSSIHRKLSSLNAFYRHGLRLGQFSSNPVKGITKPKRSKRLPTFVEERSITKLYEHLGNRNGSFDAVRDQLMMRLFYETGMRVSELTELTDADVDRSLGQVKVIGKRNKTRFIPVSADLLKEIAYYQERRKLEVSNDGHFSLFVTGDGKKMSRNVVYLLVKSYLSTITTLKKKSPHVLRHSFATHMLNNGADLNVIKEILGHSSLAATQVYTHLSIEKLKGVHKQLHPRSSKN
jgi:integrase/recombinase XerC